LTAANLTAEFIFTDGFGGFYGDEENADGEMIFDFEILDFRFIMSNTTQVKGIMSLLIN